MFTVPAPCIFPGLSDKIFYYSPPNNIILFVFFILDYLCNVLAALDQQPSSDLLKLSQLLKADKLV